MKRRSWLNPIRIEACPKGCEDKSFHAHVTIDPRNPILWLQVFWQLLITTRIEVTLFKRWKF